MEEKSIMLLIVGTVLVVAIAGIALTFSSSSTGMVSSYQQIRSQGEILYANDPAQHVPIDDDICRLAQTRPTTFDSFIQRQCEYLNPGRQGLKADCIYHSKLMAQLKCTAAPVFENIGQPQTLV